MLGYHQKGTSECPAFFWVTINKVISTGLLALGLLPLSGKEAPRFGLQGGIVLPQGDLKQGVDSKQGLTLGAHCTFDLGNGFEVRPRVDYLQFPSWKRSSSYTSFGTTYWDNSSTQFSHTAIGVDGIVHPAENQKAFYLVGGISYIAWKGEYAGSFGMSGAGGNTAISESESRTWNKPGFSIGVGYLVGTRGFLEARYTMSKIGDDDSSANLLVFGAGFRF